MYSYISRPPGADKCEVILDKYHDAYHPTLYCQHMIGNMVFNVVNIICLKQFVLYC